MQLSFFIISLILLAIGYVPYFIGIFRGKIRPHPITWLAWAIITLIQALVLLYNGGGFATWIFAILVFIDVAVFVLGLKFAKKVTITTNDWICFGSSIVALIFWLSIDSPEIATLVIVLALFIGFIPALKKAYFYPHDESAFSWSINGLRGAFTVFIVASFSYTTIFNPAFWAVIYIGAAVFLLIRRKQLGDVKTVPGEKALEQAKVED